MDKSVGDSEDDGNIFEFDDDCASENGEDGVENTPILIHRPQTEEEEQEEQEEDVYNIDQIDQDESVSAADAEVEQEESSKTTQTPEFVEVETIIETSSSRSIQTQTDPRLRKSEFAPLDSDEESTPMIKKGRRKKRVADEFDLFGEEEPKRKSVSHNTEEALKCPFCERAFISLVKHMKSKHHDEADYDEEMRNAKWRERIMKLSSNGGEEAGGTCPECGKITKDLKRHLQHHQQNRVQTACPICGKVVLKAGIQSHMRTVHSGRKPHKCPHCDYTSAFRGNLNTHMKGIHLHTRQYLCDVCKAAFKTLGALLGHTKRVHEGWKSPNQKIFVCSVCEKRFTKKYHVDRHMLIHTGEKPFKCNDCARCFNNKSNLMSHIQMVHKKLSPYQCDLCQETFKRKKVLLEHIGKAHVGEMTPRIKMEGDEFEEYMDDGEEGLDESVASGIVQYDNETPTSVGEETYTAILTDGNMESTSQAITALQADGTEETIIILQTTNPEEVAQAIFEHGSGAVQFESGETISGTTAAELFSQMQS